MPPQSSDHWREQRWVQSVDRSLAAFALLTTSARRQASLLASLTFVTLMLAAAYAADNLAWAIYALSFWHYLLYWLAYYYRAVALRRFARDAVLMKTISLIALGCIYLLPGPNAASLVVVTAGFLLNTAAAWVLGADRTYYGQEIAGLPARRIASFPYSCLAHPMLLGNLAAFGGLLLDADFRRHWWPVAAAHVLFNLSLLVMELFVRPRGRGGLKSARRSQRSRSSYRWAGLGYGVAAAIVANLGFLLGGPTRGPSWLFAATIDLSAAVYAFVLYRCYSAPHPSVEY